MAESEKTISSVIKEINKKYSNGSVVFGSDIAKVEVIDTNCFSLNNILGCGGLPKGRLIEISGAPSSGKTAMALYIAAQVQKKGGKVLWVDAERVFNPDYTKKIGVDIKKMAVSTPESGEEALDTVEKLVSTGEYSLVVVDSVAALTPQKELDSEPTDVSIALIAKMMSRHLRVITAVASKTNTCIIYINQTRDNLMTFGYGKKTVTTGGKALPFYASVRLEVKVISKIKGKNDDIIGNNLRIRAEKNKCGLPFRSGDISLYFESGIDVIGDILDVAQKQGLVEKTGSTYVFGENRIIGKEKARKHLEENPKIVEELKNKLI